MEQSKKHRANSLGMRLLMLALVICLTVVVVYLAAGSEDPRNDPAVIVLSMAAGLYWVLVIWVIAGELLFPYYLTKEGVLQFRFGKVARVTPWEDVSQVCIVRDSLFSTKGGSCIYIVTQAAPSYVSTLAGPTTMYYLRNRKHIIRLDHWEISTELIRSYYGKVTDFRRPSKFLG